ncbi:fumarylacetoacetate hydrolase family protein [Aquibacillus koreensis]|uniref:Fumarylacetoacetate hydrolase family protein n=1 Tax=Aquibacillus koreensis TaxID=279446 RepID=A0A9X4AJZ3_9BACI|nr:fumarylacetoacetate hydrolase family protein [Aquibacillus koreensis]MCT2538131.1 fumarylacetoacetate hydrolase family protein [Aquibacillus koreensis]MDC3420925.1 fumarylacetoacetate hydrolase family protein [Aquibacillus koreensis]
MKLVSYKTKKSFGSYRMGIMYPHGVVDLQEAYRDLLVKKGEREKALAVDILLPSHPDAFYKLGKFGIEKAVDVSDFLVEPELSKYFIAEQNVSLGTPVPNPSKIICIGTNYKDHVAEMKSTIPDYPVLFSKFANALIGPEDKIKKSKQTTKLDYEIELAVVIGKEACEVPEQDALEYVAGYTIGNDISARDLQKRTPQWLQGKSLDGSTPIGPWIVTTDELPDPSNLELKTKINGEVRQSSNTKHLIFNVPTIISFISNLMTLQPGDVILTGTPDGVGFGMNPPQFLQSGDVITMEIEGIGELENTVE